MPVVDVPFSVRAIAELNRQGTLTGPKFLRNINSFPMYGTWLLYARLDHTGEQYLGYVRPYVYHGWQ